MAAVTLQLGDGVTAGTSIASSVPVTVDAGAILALNLSAGELFGNDISNSGLVTTIASSTNMVSGVISGSGAFPKWDRPNLPNRSEHVHGSHHGGGRYPADRKWFHGLHLTNSRS